MSGNMIYEIKKTVPARIEKTQLSVTRCLKCNGDDIRIDEYEDNYGFISSATCAGCKTKIKEDTTAAGIIESWNRKNDINLLLIAKAQKIKSLAAEIKGLKQKQRDRAKKKPGPKKG